MRADAVGIGVGDEVVDGDDDRHVEGFQVLDMAPQIGAARPHRPHVLGAQRVARHAGRPWPSFA